MRKRIFYWISAPGLWWIHGLNTPVALDDPGVANKNKASNRQLRTMRRAMAVADHLPKGTIITRFMWFRGKLYELRSWEKIG